MLSTKMKNKNRIISICENSDEIKVGDIFDGAEFADESEGIKTKIVFCGKISEEELLFRSLSGRFYFSISDGWGEKNGILYGIKKGFLFDFGHPTTEENITFECEQSLGTYHSSVGAMAYQSKKSVLDKIMIVINENMNNT